MLLSASHPPASASPHVELDDPVYQRLAALQALGRLPPYAGGLRPLTQVRVWRLLREAGEREEAEEDPSQKEAAWVVPLRRVALRSLLFRDQARPYSTDVRPRNLAGELALSCERQRGRPCGDGLALATELEAASGYGPWVAGVVRLRAAAGTADHDERLELDRAYVNAELGPLAVEVGRDILVLGPSSRTQLAWGTNAPPLDHVRVSTSEPFDLVGPDGAVLRGNLLYVVGRLREPQTFPGNLVTMARGQIDLFNRIELGMMQLLQLGGEGAASIGLLDFVAEHVRRRDPSAGPSDSSNRRLAFDLAAQVPALMGARFYYQLVFEDLRDAMGDAVRYDADHLVGAELAAIGPGRRHGLVVELVRTGVRSHEHSPRTTGFTHGGRLAGSSLGPDARSVYVGGRLELGWGAVLPWAELARLSSDTYTFVEDGGISRATRGTSELRYRGGGRLRLPLRNALRVEVEALLENVERSGFERGRRTQSLGVAAQLAWRPRFERDQIASLPRH
jgi:hypothetical protein